MPSRVLYLNLNKTQLDHIATNLTINDTLMVSITYLGGERLRDINNFEVESKLTKEYPFKYYSIEDYLLEDVITLANQ